MSKSCMQPYILAPVLTANGPILLISSVAHALRWEVLCHLFDNFSAPVRPPQLHRARTQGPPRLPRALRHYRATAQAKIEPKWLQTACIQNRQATGIEYFTCVGFSWVRFRVFWGRPLGIGGIPILRVRENGFTTNRQMGGWVVHRGRPTSIT